MISEKQLNDALIAWLNEIEKHGGTYLSISFMAQSGRWGCTVSTDSGTVRGVGDAPAAAVLDALHAVVGTTVPPF